MLENTLNTLHEYRITNTTSLSIHWLCEVWRLIVSSEGYDLNLFSNIPLVPVLHEGTWLNPQSVSLVKLTSLLLIQTCDGDKLSDGICDIFKMMGVNVLSKLPNWIPVDKVKQFFFWPNDKSIIALFSTIHARDDLEQTVYMFNKSCSNVRRRELLSFLMTCQSDISQNTGARNVLKRLNLFPVVNRISDDTTDDFDSISKCQRYINGSRTEYFPKNVPLPFRCLLVKSSCNGLMISLGARMVHLDELVTEALKRCEKADTGVHVFMEYFVKNFYRFRDKPAIVKIARRVPFLLTSKDSTRYKACELFDPTNDRIQDLLYNEFLTPEIKQTLNDEIIVSLRVLGLREESSIDAELLLQVAQTLDKVAVKKLKNINYEKKAVAFISIISSRPLVLNDICYNNQDLKTNLASLSCICVQKQAFELYPKCIPWYEHDKEFCRPTEARDVQQCLLVGGTMPTVVCKSDRLREIFPWKQSPPFEKVIQQLRLLRNNFTVKRKSEVMPSIKKIFDHMNRNIEQVIKHNSVFRNEDLIWTGENFVSAERIAISRREDDIDLEPYFFRLSPEYEEFALLLEAIGCKSKQDETVLLNVLHFIKSEHSSTQPESVVNRDRLIVCNILTKLASLKNMDAMDESRVLMMVRDQNVNSLKLYPISVCTYDDDPAAYSELDDNVYLVHEMIPHPVAEDLGVHSITKKSVLEADELGMEEWEQKERLTARIGTLLHNGYTDGLSIPKELIQNADDAGASEVKFLYDERVNRECRERVLSKGMRGFQGPALWVFNNRVFTEGDLINITKLNEGTKKADSNKIGKFGLGFCSVYNITDLPSFITGSSIVFFDPHEKYLNHVRKCKGLRYKLPNQTLVSRHIDQFKPYNGIFNCNVIDFPKDGYQGSLFRLPLRTTEQAKVSDIFGQSYTHDDILKLLELTIEAAGNMLLFTQNVQSIQIYHIAENALDAANPELLFTIQRTSKLLNDEHIPFEPILPRLSVLTNTDIVKENHIYSFEQTVSEQCKTLIGMDNILLSTSKTLWIVSWATGNKRSLEMYKSCLSDNSFPVAAVAIPYCNDKEQTGYCLESIDNFFYRTGHLFCFLPLPVKTGLPVHINGCFSVSNDRRQLVLITDDDKNKPRKTWNEALMEDALVNAYVHLLESIQLINLDSTYKYYKLWPMKGASDVTTLKQAFFKHIIATNAIVFCVRGKWLPFEDVIFLDPKLSKGPLGDIMFYVASYFAVRPNKTVIEMPDLVLENIQNSNKDMLDYIKSKAIDGREMSLLIIQNIDSNFWLDKSEMRNQLLHFALNLSDAIVNEVIKKSNCIPTVPNNKLRKPSELINPECSIASLFNENDGRFPITEHGFRDIKTLKLLTDIGMITEHLPHDLIIDRCISIAETAKNCCNCAYKRCRILMTYMSNDKVLADLKLDTNTIDIISNTDMFPILPVPCSWAFSWKANEKQTTNIICEKGHNNYTKKSFGKAKDLFRRHLVDLIGTIECVADESIYGKDNANKERIISVLHIKGIREIKQEKVVKQMENISAEYKNPQKQYSELKRLHNSIFSYFETYLTNGYKSKKVSSRKDIHLFERLSTIPVVLVHKKLLKSCYVAFNLRHEFHPLLYKVPSSAQNKFRTVYTILGVKSYFCIDDVLKAFSFLKKYWGQNKDEDIENTNSLLKNLQESMEHSKLSFDDISEKHEMICAPDISHILMPTSKLVIENEEFITSESMNILHHGIVPRVAHSLGVSTKQSRCFDDISKGIPFGQKEKLGTRIKGLLSAYPCDSSIMNELLQNADDAGATEINFIKDYRTHSTKRLFSDISKPLQGPSLCVYNNSYFTNKDIEGIHNLGQGSKNQDPLKTGQYGVGFNSVYHLTDTPSFLTQGPDDSNGGLLVFLDPLCKHVPKANPAEPGQMCSLDGVQKNFPDHLLGYSSDILIKNKKGTVFRLPLRTEKSEISTEIVDTKRMDEILLSFVNDMYDSLLFLKNISCIKISNITTGEYCEEYSVHVRFEIDAKRKKVDFNSKMRGIVKQNRNNKVLNLEVSPLETVYKMNISDTNRFSKTWMIVQRFGFGEILEDIEMIKNEMNDGQIGQLPLGGVAIPLDENESNDEHVLTCNFNARAFCFLPLPLQTGFPLHVNGHFVLDHEARRNIGKEGYKQKWNYCLANRIIIPSWITGLIRLQTEVERKINIAKTWEDVSCLLDSYHKVFPLPNQKQDEFWTDLIHTFYKVVLDEKIKLFPCIFDMNCEFTPPSEYLKESKLRFQILWCYMSNNLKCDSESGVFNDIAGSNHSKLIENMLKSFGLKLVSTPSKIWKFVKKLGHAHILVSTPDLVINHFESITNPIKTNFLGNVNIHVTKTKFLSSFNLKMLINFMRRDNNFYQRLQGLPILLTADSVLRYCSKEYPVYVSEFAKLLPCSSSYFVHRDMHYIFNDSDAIKTDCFRYLKVNDFVKLLPDNKDKGEFACGKDVQLSKISDRQNISYHWLCMLYDFLVSESLTNDDKYTFEQTNYNSLNQNLKLSDALFVEHLKMLENWSFLPCRRQHVVETEINLIAVSKASYVIHLHAERLQEEVGISFQRLALPELCVRIFNDCRYADSITRVMQGQVASLDSPSILLECLFQHKKHLETCSITPPDALNILSYFAGHLSALKDSIKNDQHLQRKIKVLPLFPTQQISLTSVLDMTEVIVLPKGIPYNGIQEWADELNITLLQNNDSVNSLYTFLGFTMSDVNTVYAEHILPSFHKIPRTYWMCHIDFLRKRLNNKITLSTVEERIIKVLKSVPFILVGQQTKKACELYSPKNDVFASMMSDDCFPPVTFLSNEWYGFLVRLGLITKVDDAMLLRFAQEIERAGSHRMTSDIENKSKTLLTCFHTGKRTWKNETLTMLKKIRFIIPYQVSDELKHVFRQFSDGQTLIQFENSISEKQKMLCWTSMSLIDNSLYESIDKNVCNSLQIYQSPPLEKVILHCQNVCDSFKSLLKTRNIDKDFIKEQMKKIYKYINEIGTVDETLKKRLYHTPIVYLPEDEDIVTINDVVIELPKDKQVKPYLYAAPVYYGEYFELFKRLGCMESVDFTHYARVLETLRSETQGKEMMISERVTARQAIRCIIYLKAEAYRKVNECKCLYLPNRDMVLMNAKDLFLSDHISYESRLQGNLKMEYFSGFKELNISLHSKEGTVFLNLPNHLRPALLTEAVKEDICLDNSTIICNSPKAIKIERFLHSEHLINGLHRLLKQQSLNSGEKCREEWLDEIHIQLKSIKVIHVTNIKTILYFKGDFIRGTEKEINCYTKVDTKEQKKIFYFKDDSNTENLNTTKLLQELTKLILSCSKGLKYDSTSNINLMVQEIENPEMIQSALDDIGLDQFDVPKTQEAEYFPNPGTAVDKKFLPFLEQGIYPFKDYEYKNVAMDLDDELGDVASKQEPIYIYVHIKDDASEPNCSNLSHIYLVDTGNPNIQFEKVPIYRLYRFVRKREDVGHAVEQFVDGPVFAYPVDENCKRIREELLEAWTLSKEDRRRVIRRLYLKWYPDRNLMNREYCTEVFNYIMVVLSRLENEEVPTINVNTDIARGRSNMSSTSFYYANIKTRADAYAQAFNDNIQEYRRSCKQGLFCHKQVQLSKRQDITEAKRWLRQAKCDFLAAKTFASVADDIDGFNWICYTCHQVNVSNVLLL